MENIYFILHLVPKEGNLTSRVAIIFLITIKN
jgi:hypothetical protein